MKYELFTVAELPDFDALRGYIGKSSAVVVSGLSGTPGLFSFDPTDTTSADDGVDLIVANNGKRWVRISAQVSALADIEAARVAAIADVDAQGDTSVAAVQTAQTTAETAVDALVTQAEDARDDAQTAANSALAATRIYESTAAGLAAVANGEYFYVPSTVEGEIVILYKDDGGVAQEINRVPSSELLEPLRTITPAGYVWAIADQDGKAALGVDDDGNTNAHSLVVNTINGVSADQILAGAAAGSASSSNAARPRFTADIIHIVVYGQSLSNGSSVDTLLSVTQPYNNLMFAAVRPQDDPNPATRYAAFNPLVETEITPAEGAGVGTYQRETPCAGLGEYLREILQANHGIAYTDPGPQFLFSAPGYGGFNIGQLSQGTAPYIRMMEDVQAGYDLAQAAGKTYAVAALCWLQGESDGATAIATYKAALETLRADFEADVNTITGGSDTIPLITYQTQGSSNGTLAQVEAADTYPNIYMAGPHYHLPKSDTVHFTGLGSKRYGAYLAHTVYTVCMLEREWTELKVSSMRRQGNILFVEYDVPVGDLVLDTTTLANQGDYGIQIKDNGGVAQTISSVALAGPRELRIVCSAAVPVGGTYEIALNTGKSNLRDSAGDTQIFAGASNFAKHNFARAEKVTIS